MLQEMKFLTVLLIMQCILIEACVRRSLHFLVWTGKVLYILFSIEPNERALLEEGVSLFALGQNLDSICLVRYKWFLEAFPTYADVQEKMVISEHKRLCKMGYFNQSDEIEHLGRRGYSDGFMHISRQYNSSNLVGSRLNLMKNNGKTSRKVRKLLLKSKEQVFKGIRFRGC